VHHTESSKDNHIDFAEVSLILVSKDRQGLLTILMQSTTQRPDPSLLENYDAQYDKLREIWNMERVALIR